MDVEQDPYDIAFQDGEGFVFIRNPVATSQRYGGRPVPVLGVEIQNQNDLNDLIRHTYGSMTYQVITMAEARRRYPYMMF